MAIDTLTQQRLTWRHKPVLRAIYREYYQRIISACVEGATLEVGGGAGNLKEHLGSVVSTDIVSVPWIDVAADGQQLPFADGAFGNVVCVDVLHHIERPCAFLTEAVRVLRPGGRLVLLEPAVTPISYIFYRFFHPEPVEMGVNPLEHREPDATRSPFDANQAVPTLLFGKYAAAFKRQFPSFEVLERSRCELFAYPLSGGFRRWSALPERFVNPLLNVERWLVPFLGPVMAFRLFIVLGKNNGGRSL